jgi:HD-GYP domain-containing protein (c-di-GMP phosphodiesterase class II)
VTEGSAGRRFSLYAAAGIVAGALVWALASVVLGAARDELASGLVPALLGLAVAVAVTAAAARTHVNALRARAETAEQERRAGEERLDVERRKAAALDRARRAERAWAAELRSQVLELHRRQGPLGHRDDDTRSLVLKTAISALEAEKGVLLERGDGDSLTVEHSEGFEHDPADSALARRFAEAVIERDETVRENDSRSLEREGRTAADEEIENLVAIPIYLRDDFAGVVVCANREGGFEAYDDDVLLALGDHAGAVLHNERLRGELRTSYVATVSMLSDAIAAKDPFVGGHSEEVSAYVSAVAERLGIDQRRREELVFGSLLHDLGKIGISERILLKPAGLTVEERAIVELHPRIGYKLVSRIPRLETIALAVLHHHERWDGTGYPGRLKGEQIPLEARIIGVADAFSAMTADRPYSRRRQLAEACAEIERCAGSQFDPAVAAAFVEEVRRRPPALEQRGRLAGALDDPELTQHRDGNERLLGTGSLAVIDNLTLLYSHRYLHEVAEAAAREAGAQSRPFAVALAELRGLEAVNERDGHAAGDELIRDAARALQQAALHAGGTACRYGGPRLAMVAPGADAEAAGRLLAEAMAVLPPDADVRIGAASGDGSERGADVIRRARQALRAEAAA